jgi:hypothetical protein
MWEPQPLTTLWASKACRGENFTSYLLTYSNTGIFTSGVSKNNQVISSKEHAGCPSFLYPFPIFITRKFSKMNRLYRGSLRNIVYHCRYLAVAFSRNFLFFKYVTDMRMQLSGTVIPNHPQVNDVQSQCFFSSHTYQCAQLIQKLFGVLLG